MAEVPSRKKNATVPVGPPAAGGTGTTLAVNVTLWPTLDGFGLETRVVTVPEMSAETACTSTTDSDGWKSASPL